ncbi:MAG: NAD(P)/FAD-dependent oxidoreductase [Thermoleophilia bacterium]|nr:NAD(P)/FAD-dependent oxidoreductase [Thermoleophilia bacterium]
MTASTVVVLGGGTGGLVAARALRRRLGREHRVILVDRALRYAFAPSFLWVLTGERRPEQVTRDLGRLRRRGIEVLETEALSLDTAGRAVETSAGRIAYDRLVVAVGAELAPELLPGFARAAHTVYTLDGAVAAAGALRDFPGGRVAVLVPSLPYRCPAAPYETAFLVEAALRRRGLAADSSVEVYTPEPFPLPTAGPEVGAALRGLLEQRGIGFHPGLMAERIDAPARELVFADGTRVGYDLLLGVPPHRPPALVRTPGLAPDGGFVPVDRGTLAAGADGVFALGDVTAIPVGGGKFLPKAGVFAHAQAEVVARRIAAELAGRAPSATFDGHGGCFVELGDGAAAYGSGDFYAEPAPAVRLRSPGRRWHLGKVLFERYWLARWF